MLGRRAFQIVIFLGVMAILTGCAQSGKGFEASFSPTEVKVGETVTIDLTAYVSICKYKIDIYGPEPETIEGRELTSGGTEKVSFIPKKVGDYRIKITVFSCFGKDYVQFLPETLKVR